MNSRKTKSLKLSLISKRIIQMTEMPWRGGSWREMLWVLWLDRRSNFWSMRCNRKYSNRLVRRRSRFKDKWRAYAISVNVAIQRNTAHRRRVLNQGENEKKTLLCMKWGEHVARIDKKANRIAKGAWKEFSAFLNVLNFNELLSRALQTGSLPSRTIFISIFYGSATM